MIGDIFIIFFKIGSKCDDFLHYLSIYLRNLSDNLLLICVIIIDAVLIIDLNHLFSLQSFTWKRLEFL